jgi:ribonuclease R
MPQKKTSTKNTRKKTTREESLFKNLLKVTYEFIKGKHYAPLSKSSLIDRLRIHEDHFAIFEQVLKNLKEEGKIHLTEEKYLPRFENKASPDIVRGFLRVHPRGFGFVEVEGSDDPDIFIPKPYINNAIDSDIVEVLINRESISEKGPEGKVLSIIERKRQTLVCIIVREGQRSALAYSQVMGQGSNVLVESTSPTENLDLIVGDRIVAEVLSWGSKQESTKAKLLRKIGNISDPSKDVEVAILESELREDFPAQAEAEALEFGSKVSSKDLIGREDLRDLECFTIDPDTAKDFDDAISLVQEDDKYIVGIHIADVSHYVKPDSELDKEARLRCNSTYFPGICIPMLPRALSDNLCSLKEGVVRLTVSVFVELSKNGEVLSWRIARTAIKSAKRFTYKQAKKVIDGVERSKHRDTILEMVNVCRLLQKKRSERGSVQLSMPELVVKVDENGVPTGTEIVQYDISHQLVEEFMLLANETVAIHLSKQGKDLTYRIHEEPSKENLREFAVLAEAFGFKLSQDPTPQEIQKFFVEVEGSPFAQYLSTCYIRSMRLACYSADNIGHYGLSLQHYCHFTSPIRRYVDVIAHRLLFSEAQDKKVITDICNRASERERISAKAENSVLALKKLRLLDTITKDQRNRQFEAVITRVKPFGIYFDITELMHEGFLHISDLDNDYFYFDEKRLLLYGRHHDITYRAGDPLFVMIKHIDYILQEVSWELVAHPSSATDGEKRKGRRKKKK